MPQKDSEENWPDDESEDAGLSLDMLSATFAEALGAQPAPYEADAVDPDADAEESAGVESTAEAVQRIVDQEPVDDPCELSPRTILEALLFVGNPGNEPLSAEKAASVMRGVAADEIEDLVRQLNGQYEVEGCPYEILPQGDGFRLTLRGEYSPLRDKFYGKVREAKLSQPAIDVLSLVAYHPGLTREEVDQMRGKSSGPLLNQLVRRQLLRIEPDAENRRTKRYFSTERFLQTFGLRSLDDLPQPQILDGE